MSDTAVTEPTQENNNAKKGESATEKAHQEHPVPTFKISEAESTQNQDTSESKDSTKPTNTQAAKYEAEDVRNVESTNMVETSNQQKFQTEEAPQKHLFEEIPDLIEIEGPVSTPSLTESMKGIDPSYYADEISKASIELSNQAVERAQTELENELIKSTPRGTQEIVDSELHTTIEQFTSSNTLDIQQNITEIQDYEHGTTGHETEVKIDVHNSANSVLNGDGPSMVLEDLEDNAELELNHKRGLESTKQNYPNPVAEPSVSDPSKSGESPASTVEKKEKKSKACFIL